MRILTGVAFTKEEVLKVLEVLEEDAGEKEEIDALNKMYGLSIPYDAQYRGLFYESQFIWYEEEFPDYDDGSDIGCKDCPDDECTGHCMSCPYRPI